MKTRRINLISKSTQSLASLTFSLQEIQDHKVSFHGHSRVASLSIPVVASTLSWDTVSDWSRCSMLWESSPLSQCSRLENQIEKVRGNTLIHLAHIYVTRIGSAPNTLKSLFHIDWSQKRGSWRSLEFFQFLRSIEVFELLLGIVFNFFLLWCCVEHLL